MKTDGIGTNSGSRGRGKPLPKRDRNDV